MADGPGTRDRVFEFLVKYKQQHDGLAPSIAEMARGCALHPSSVQYHLLRLEGEDRIRILGRRSIEVIGGSWEAPDAGDPR